MAVKLHPQSPDSSTWCDCHTHTHNKAAHRIANYKRALTQLITTLKGCSHLKERRSLNRRTKNLASGASKPSTDTHNGVKDAWRLWQAIIIIIKTSKTTIPIYSTI